LSRADKANKMNSALALEGGFSEPFPSQTPFSANSSAPATLIPTKLRLWNDSPKPLSNLSRPNSVVLLVPPNWRRHVLQWMWSSIAPGQPACSQCGRPAPASVPPVPGFAFEVENYAGKIRALSVVWVIYAAFSLFSGIASLTFLHAFMSNHFDSFGGHGPWGDSPFPQEWFRPCPLRLHLVQTALSPPPSRYS